MDILKGVSLKLYSTMRLGGTAEYLVNVRSRRELVQAIAWAESNKLSIRMIGAGSNIIWRDEGFKGLVIVNKIKGFRLVDEDSSTATYKIASGENWDSVVERLVNIGLSGVECLSLIPGTAGATPVQNVGAYGQDISQTLVELDAYDLLEKRFVTIDNQSCLFGYRSSRFKQTDNGRFMICSITLRLSKKPLNHLSYDALEAYFNERSQKHPTIQQIREAIINIRSHKLPDPNNIPNTGSFFANPIVNRQTHSRLVRQFNDLKSWRIGNDYKLSAAWMLEKAGFKDKIDAETGMTTWKNQPLVLVNHKAQHTSDLIKYQDKIIEAIRHQFDVVLQREPEILP